MLKRSLAAHGGWTQIRSSAPGLSDDQLLHTLRSHFRGTQRSVALSHAQHLRRFLRPGGGGLDSPHALAQARARALCVPPYECGPMWLWSLSKRLGSVPACRITMKKSPRSPPQLSTLPSQASAAT
jgi:hypothetical protein